VSKKKRGRSVSATPPLENHIGIVEKKECIREKQLTTEGMNIGESKKQRLCRHVRNKGDRTPSGVRTVTTVPGQKGGEQINKVFTVRGTVRTPASAGSARSIKNQGRTELAREKIPTSRPGGFGSQARRGRSVAQSCAGLSFRKKKK